MKIHAKQFLIKHWALVSIVGIWFIFAHPYFVRGLVPFPSKHLVTFFAPWKNSFGMPVKNGAMPDVVTQIYPWKKIVIDSWNLGQIPAWNPYQFSGTPLLANSQSSVFTPLNILFFILPFVDAWSLLILLQPLMAGIGIYLFARSLGLSNHGVLLSSISYMFCGFLTVWMPYGTLGWAALSLPWILWSLVRLSRVPSFKHMICTGMLIAFSLFSGHMQTSFYVIGASVLFVFFQRKSLAKGILAILLGCIIAAPQLFATIGFYEQSVRSGLFQKIEVIPWNYLPTLFAPDVLGNPVTRNDWFGHYAEWATYAGVIPFILSLMGGFVAYRKQKIVLYFAMLIVLSILLAYQTPLLDAVIFLKIPILSTSAASRIVVLLSFSIAMLSGFAIDGLLNIWNANKRRGIVYGIFWILLVSGIWAGFLWGNVFGIESVDPEKLQVAQNNFILPTLLIFSCVGLMLLGYIRLPRLRQGIVVLFILITAFDMLRFSSKWMPFDPREYVYPSIPVLSYLSKEGGFERVYGNFGNEAQSMFGLYGIEGYDPLYLSRYGQLISASGNGTLGPLERTVVRIDRQGQKTKRLLDMLSVKLVLHAKGDGQNIWAFPYWKYPDLSGAPIYSDDHYEVYRNGGAMPRAYFVPSYVVKTDDQEILDILLSDSTDLRSTVVLEENPEGIASGQDVELIEQVRIGKFTPNEVVVEVRTNRKGLLVLTDPYYEGWSAYINNEKTKIYRANFALRAIVVPEGESSVRFVYDHWFL